MHGEVYHNEALNPKTLGVLPVLYVANIMSFEAAHPG